MVRWVLPGEGYDFFGEVKIIGEFLFAFVVDGVVEFLPVEDKIDVSSIGEGPHDFAEVDVGDVGANMGSSGEILVDDDDSFLEEVSANCFPFGF